MEIEFKKIFKLVDNGNLTYNLHSLCYQNNILISEFDLGDVEGILVQLKKQKEINQKAVEYIKENKEKYYQDWGQDDGSCDTYLDENEVLKLLQILEDKEVKE